MKQIILALPLVFLLGGCSPSVPKCGDSETTDLIKQIANDEMINQLGSNAGKMFSYSVNAIRTTDKNDKTGAFECAAQLEIHARNTGNSSEIPITYTVEMTDNGKEFYVNVYGLK
ncbi:hypothetical protein CAG54_12955 [Vibrio sp. V27_P1S3P104]|uniref:hypothetical protein n=1 Tax=Vibrio TaxID=662 RepID=UPI000C1664EB|nr:MULTISPECIES: hypothetical protein [Vibrio]NAW69445.1 hypothetical protein [Vibrio sp. V28_P6S34P95]NAX38410.1 hypothetical protein [Vibrio sp. V27_P1S3P104]NNN43337.1 hypothetical protein [Vibrio sp. 1-1(7)]NNN71161.1 hypothetical protein [Vibrio sp. 12-2(3-a)]